MATKPDIIVLDEEKYPHIATVGTKVGENLALEYYELDDEQFQYIPPHVHLSLIHISEPTRPS